MTALKITLVLLGLLFSLFGYLIFFRGRYGLINGFRAEERAGRKNERYARRVGLTELTIGILLLVAGIVLILFC